MKSGYQLPVSPLMIFTGLLRCCFRHLAFILSALPHYSRHFQSPDAHPDPTRRWLAVAAAGVFIYLPGGLAVR
ncbi:benzoate/H(+) symporter BenE family transporter [Salmonella enterica]|uniref:benzoate/H(+) symporter BenE family transporter n=1 Tax=Salmonella enterica TaxID=28901 RepID=UPI003D2EDF16